MLTYEEKNDLWKEQIVREDENREAKHKIEALEQAIEDAQLAIERLQGVIDANDIELLHIEEELEKDEEETE